MAPRLTSYPLSMNWAAERTAPKAKTLFLDAVKEMTFEDARKILQGSDDAATRYFEDKIRGGFNNSSCPSFTRPWRR
jgi:hypothetical protein